MTRWCHDAAIAFHSTAACCQRTRFPPAFLSLRRGNEADKGTIRRYPLPGSPGPGPRQGVCVAVWGLVAANARARTAACRHFNYGRPSALLPAPCLLRAAARPLRLGPPRATAGTLPGRASAGPPRVCCGTGRCRWAPRPRSRSPPGRVRLSGRGGAESGRAGGRAARRGAGRARPAVRRGETPPGCPARFDPRLRRAGTEFLL